MKIHELKIEGFKSIGSITLVEPNPFSVFVGPNAAGKSNIFEALEFMELCNLMSASEVIKLFGNSEEILNQHRYIKEKQHSEFFFDLGDLQPDLKLNYNYDESKQLFVIGTIETQNIGFLNYEIKDIEDSFYYFLTKDSFKAFSNFTRLFVKEPESKVKRKLQDDSRLTSDASNLEKVLKRILKDEKNKEEIIEILQLLIPGFSNVEIRTEELSGSDNLLIYEDALKKPLTKEHFQNNFHK